MKASFFLEILLYSIYGDYMKKIFILLTLICVFSISQVNADNSHDTIMDKYSVVELCEYVHEDSSAGNTKLDVYMYSKGNASMNVLRTFKSENLDMTVIIKSHDILTGFYKKNKRCPAYALVHYIPSAGTQVWVNNSKVALESIYYTNKYDSENAIILTEINNDPDDDIGAWDEDYNGDLDLSGICTKGNVPRTLQFVGVILYVIKVLVPFLIIVFGVIDIVKVVMSGKEEDMKKSATSLIKRVAIGVIIFFIPSLTNFILNQTGTDNPAVGQYSNCYNCILEPNKCEK